MLTDAGRSDGKAWVFCLSRVDEWTAAEQHRIMNGSQGTYTKWSSQARAMASEAVGMVVADLYMWVAARDGMYHMQ